MIAKQLFDQITQQEHALTSADLNTLGWQRALSASQQRLDRMAGLIASSVSPGIACQAGCWYCCYFMVEVRAEEASQIADYVHAHFTAERAREVKNEIVENATALRDKSREQKLTANRKCAFLDGGKCSIYEVRPARCRTFHARDVAGCKQAFEEPTNLHIPNTLVPELLHTGEAHLKGFRQAFTDAGHDDGVYEMNAALVAITRTGPAFERAVKSAPGREK